MGKREVILKPSGIRVSVNDGYVDLIQHCYGDSDAVSVRCNYRLRSKPCRITGEIIV